MKISGFTLVRNGLKFDYPFLESLRSLLPLCDELVINVGDGEDDTATAIEDFARTDGQGKVKIFSSVWPVNDAEKKRGGLILSEQTNLALKKCTGDWCLYLQADEVLHEADYENLKQAFLRAEGSPDIEGLLFDYIHLYGSYHVMQESRSAYRREVRAVRRSANPVSVGDAQSFRKVDGTKLQVIRAGARVFHYGWVRTPEAMREKTFFMDQLYHGPPSAREQQSVTPKTGENYRYKKFWGLKPFSGQHPTVMRKRIQKQGWSWDLKNSTFVWNWKDAKKVALDLLEKITGHRFFEYRSYKLKKAP